MIRTAVGFRLTDLAGAPSTSVNIRVVFGVWMTIDTMSLDEFVITSLSNAVLGVLLWCPNIKMIRPPTPRVADAAMEDP